ncbi:MAG TPA: tyrosine-type recombinase/integrase [Lacibacter sp.]|nr:tyrosine-type recombinase/integrase [Lacibacter sp.]HMO90516.1 tyrosine-type recombinase/integrase [Lacibacter sp.]HMP88502.1 tyrosine-type recombinase/integrase [Lacibacter sp.]
MDTSRITCSLVEHRGSNRILLQFPRDDAAEKAVRQLEDARWSKTLRGWHLPDTPENRRLFDLATEELTKAPAKRVPVPETGVPLSANNQAQLQAFLNRLALKKYSASTCKTYRNEFMQLLLQLKETRVQDLTADRLQRYMLYCTEQLQLSENTLHSRLNALKFYFEQVLGREKFFWEIPRPKKQLQLPRHFSKEEVTQIIRAAGPVKHKTMLMLAYGCGLRVSEVVRLKVNDIDSSRLCLNIRQAKGKKDRVVRLSPLMLVLLRQYWTTERPPRDGYLFPGQVPGEPYSTRSLQLVLAAAKKKAGVLKPGSMHALRHSFATHLLDKGTDVTMIMKLLGHNSIRTTLRYLHVTNRDLLGVMSPLDDLDL